MWAIEVELTPKPLARTTRIMTGLLSPLRYAQVIYLTAPPARLGGDAGRGRRCRPGSRPGSWSGTCRSRRSPRRPGRDRVGLAEVHHLPVADPQGLQADRVAAAGGAAVAAWPVTVVAATGYVPAWLRGWPPVRLYRAAAWSLPVTAAWLADLEIRVPGFLAARDPGRTWAGGWNQLTAAHLAGVFAALAPVTLPAGLALAGLVWAWRNYAVTAGLAGIMASASITFDARQWGRQVRTAAGLARAPGAVPLLARGNKIPVGGTIRAIGHPWHPVFTLDLAACARHMVIVGSTGSGKTNLMIRLWAGWFTATLQASRAGRGAGRCWSCWTARAAGTPARKPNGPAACSTAPGPAASPSGRTRPACPSGTCPRRIWRCCCTR